MNVLPPPGPARRRQVGLLIVVLIALAGVYWSRREPAVAPVRASNSRVAAAPSVPALKAPERVRLDRLAAVSDASDVGRNPFGFGMKPAPPAPPPVSLPGPASAAPIVPVAPPEPAGPPPIALKLVGMVVATTGARPMVTLKDPATGALFRAYEGDVVDGRYRVIKVGLQSVVLAYVDGTGQRTIALGG